MCGKYQLAIDFCQVLFFWLMVCRAISCSIGARFELGCTHYYEVSAGVTDVQTEIEHQVRFHLWRFQRCPKPFAAACEPSCHRQAVQPTPWVAEGLETLEAACHDLAWVSAGAGVNGMPCMMPYDVDDVS